MNQQVILFLAPIDFSVSLFQTSDEKTSDEYIYRLNDKI